MSRRELETLLGVLGFWFMDDGIARPRRIRTWHKLTVTVTLTSAGIMITERFHGKDVVEHVTQELAQLTIDSVVVHLSNWGANHDRPVYLT
jgi:hypothetical protein